MQDVECGRSGNWALSDLQQLSPPAAAHLVRSALGVASTSDPARPGQKALALWSSCTPVPRGVEALRGLAEGNDRLQVRVMRELLYAGHRHSRRALSTMEQKNQNRRILGGELHTVQIAPLCKMDLLNCAGSTSAIRAAQAETPIEKDEMSLPDALGLVMASSLKIAVAKFRSAMAIILAAAQEPLKESSHVADEVVQAIEKRHSRDDHEAAESELVDSISTNGCEVRVARECLMDHVHSTL